MRRFKFVFATTVILMSLVPMSLASNGNPYPEVSREQSLDAYQRYLDLKLFRGFHPSENTPKSAKATVVFVIPIDGQVKDVQVTKSSGLKEFDDECIQAILRRVPFRPCPKFCYGLEVTATFGLVPDADVFKITMRELTEEKSRKK